MGLRSDGLSFVCTLTSFIALSTSQYPDGDVVSHHSFHLKLQPTFRSLNHSKVENDGAKMINEMTPLLFTPTASLENVDILNIERNELNEPKIEKENERHFHVDFTPVDDTNDDVRGSEMNQLLEELLERNHVKSDLDEMLPSVVPRAPSDEEKLLSYLLTGYKASARPVMNSSHTVPVEIIFSLMHIKELDVKSQILTTTGLLILDWRDERLTWEPYEHNGLQEIIIEIKGLWKPEFAVINGAENLYEEYNQFRASIKSTGYVHWEPGGVFKTMCEIDITYYPFDDQRCKMTFGAWSYHTAKMNLTSPMNIINLDSYNTNGEWDIIHTRTHRNEFSYKEAPNEKFANIDFEIYLRRRHTFYVMNVILPSIMTSVVLLSIFFCTPAQKVQIGVVVLLSFRIFLLNVADNIPKTSDHIPLLGIYLTCTMAITTLSMVITVFVLNLHQVNDRPVPPWARSMLFLGLARVMGMCCTANALAGNSKKLSHKQSLVPEMVLTVRKKEDSIAEQNCLLEMQPQTSGSHIENNDNRRPLQNSNTEGQLSHRLKNGEKRTDHVEKKVEKPEDYAKDWRKVAEIFDRLFFWLFLLAIVISTLILFHPLTKPVRVTVENPV